MNSGLSIIQVTKRGFNQTAPASSTGIAPPHGSHAALPIACDASNARTMAVREYHYTDIWIVAADVPKSALER
ncbi:MAG: hypothetical protein MR568_01985 [Eisenbergiella massiliensis]|nr:hypothetical protein [Eisenbergiella massiliensis]